MWSHMGMMVLGMFLGAFVATSFIILIPAPPKTYIGSTGIPLPCLTRDECP